ncbi:MAG: ABC transporter ATP-binding protein [Alphaproteobacteria bacterium]|nr:ABC transporter ATP-binding protein [Alphaproteobacteria bacterium]
MTRIPGGNLVFLVRMVWRYAGDQRRALALAYGLFLAANIALAFQPVILAQLIDTAQRGGANFLPHIVALSVLYGGISFVFWGLHGPARVIERRAAFQASRRFVAMLYQTVTELPLRWHQDHHSGNTINRIRKAEKALFTFGQAQFVPLQIIVRFTASTAMLALFSPWVAAISVAASLAILAVVRHFDKTLIPLVKKTNDAEHHLSSALYDYIGNIVTVLTLRMQGNTGAEIQSRYEGIKEPFWREQVVNEYKWGSMSLLQITAQAAIVGGYIAVTVAKGDAAALGAAVAIFQYLQIIMQQFFQGSLTFEQILTQSIDVRGIDGLVADHARLVAQHPPVAPRPWRIIAIDNLNFTHDEGVDALHHLRGVSLSLRAGQKIALVGSSGSGKTTLLTLLRGLYDAQSVALTIDGEAFSSLMPLSGFTTLIPQDSELFENTVRYNLTLGTKTSEATVRQALHIAAFDEVLPKLPRGIDTDIRERGVNLSGGQKQRLALARGLIAARQSSLLLLDEPTSSVDQMTEGLIFDRLFRDYADKTIVASVHRLHLLPRFDHIVLMRDGVVVEQGDFTGLLARQGEFARLWLAHLAQVEVG